MNSNRRRFQFVILTVLLVFSALYALDRVFGVFFPSYGNYLNKQVYGFEAYDTNPRNYFDKIVRGGVEVFGIDRTNEKDRVWEGASFEGDALKVLAVGDSFTYAQGVRLQDTYVKQLEKTPGRQKIYGMNYARSGDNVNSVIKQLREFYSKRPEVKPQVVIYGYCLNDTYVDENRIPGMATAAGVVDSRFDADFAMDMINMRVPIIKSLRSDFFKFLGEQSRVLDYAISLIEKKAYSGQTIEYYNNTYDPAVNAAGLKQTFDTIQEMKSLVEQNGGRLVVAIFPLFFSTDDNYPFLSAHATIADGLTKLTVDYVDLLPVFAHYPAHRLWVHEVDQHPNEFAHKLAADELKIWLAKEQYISLDAALSLNR